MAAPVRQWLTASPAWPAPITRTSVLSMRRTVRKTLDRSLEAGWRPSEDPHRAQPRCALHRFSRPCPRPDPVAGPTIGHMENLDINSIRTLLAVWAHPDDEAYLSAGLMLRVAEAGGRVVCLTATKGEQGTDDPERWPPPQLGRHRTLELKAALSRLGVRETWMMDLPDGGCEDAAPEVPTAVIGAAIDTLRPDAIVTFGPDGITGHPDHIAVGGWTTAAWSARRSAGSLLYATMTPAFLRQHARLHDQVGFFSMAR